MTNRRRRTFLVVLRRACYEGIDVRANSKARAVRLALGGRGEHVSWDETEAPTPDLVSDSEPSGCAP